MQTRRLYPLIALIALCALAPVAAGCGDDEDGGSSESTEQSTAERVDAAVQSCNEEAAQLGGVAATALQGACTSVGAAATQAAAAAGENADEALTTAADSCDATLAQIPNAAAKDVLKELCDAIREAGSG